MALEVPPEQRAWDPGATNVDVTVPWYQTAIGYIGQIGQQFGLGTTGTATDGGGYMGPTGLVARLPSPEYVVPKWVIRLAEGAAIGGAIYEAYAHFRSTGANHKSAKRMALIANGIRPRRRRMRATNLRALKRAVRRLRGFRRAASKVHGVLGSRRGGTYYSPRRRRRRMYRRGDISPFMVEDYEDFEDAADELEEDGYDAERFQEAYE